MISMPLVLSIIFCSVCIISLLVGTYTLYTNVQAMANRVFFALSAALFIWSFGFAMAISAPELSVCLFWRRFAAIGWSVFFSLLLHS